MVAAQLDRPLAIAPRWHTAALVALIVSVAVAGTVLGGPRAAPAGGSIAAYVPMLLVQWGLVFYVSRVGRPGRSLSTLVGRRWHSPARACGDVALALALVLAIHAIEWVCTSLLGAPHPGRASLLLPATQAERFAWLLVAASAGFCEEVVYRGYLQAQLAALTRRRWLGIAAQAVLFGAAHANQGLPAACRIALYGGLFGIVAHVRKSLVPGMIAHSSMDALAGLVG